MRSAFPTIRSIVQASWPWTTTSVQRDTLLRLIAVANEQRVPLAPLIEAWSADESGVQQRRLRRLAARLREGLSLADAVEQVPRSLRDRDVLAIRFGMQTGVLSSVLAALLEDTGRPPVVQGAPPRNNIVYVCIVMLWALPLVIFTQFRLVPEILMIYEDFSIEPPGFVTATSASLIHYWWLWAAAFLGCGWFFFSAKSSRVMRRAVLVPLLRPLRELLWGDVLELLSIALNAGRSVPSALSTLARYHFDPTTRKSLLFVRNEVEQGADVWESMAEVDAITVPEVRALACSERVDNRPWVLKHLGIGKRRRVLRWLGGWSELVLPALLILLGAYVVVQCLAVLLLIVQSVEGVL